MSTPSEDRSWQQRLSALRGWRLLAAVAATLVLLFFAGYAATALLFFSGGPQDVITVPDLRGLSATEAERQLRREHLEFDEGAALPNAEVEQGAVLAQSPLPGSEVAPNTVVRLILSSGAVRTPVPNVLALNGVQAQQVLLQAGFTVDVSEVPDRKPAGRVVGIDPEPGTELPVPSPVHLTLSAGPPLVAVPDLVSLSEDDARYELEAAGLGLGDIDYDAYSAAPRGSIVAQRPAAGDRISEGSRVNVSVAGFRPPEYIRPQPRPPPTDLQPPLDPSRRPGDRVRSWQ